jgi:hypothetical protein
MQVELEQRIIIKFPTKENMDAHKIQAKLQAHFKDKAYTLRTVRFWMEEVRRAREDLRNAHRSGRSPLDHIDTQILHILGKSPFESVWSIAQTFNTSHSVVLQHLHKALSLKSFHLR